LTQIFEYETYRWPSKQLIKLSVSERDLLSKIEWRHQLKYKGNHNIQTSLNNGVVKEKTGMMEGQWNEGEKGRGGC